NPKPADQFFVFHRKSLLVFSISVLYHTAAVRYRRDFLLDLTEISNRRSCPLSPPEELLFFTAAPLSFNCSNSPAHRQSRFCHDIFCFHIPDQDTGISYFCH